MKQFYVTDGGTSWVSPTGHIWYVIDRYDLDLGHPAEFATRAAARQHATMLNDMV